MVAAEHPYRRPDVDHTRAIQAIRVAAALADRFRVLVQPKTYNSPEELSNVLGEARQVFPAIWSQLDEARAALVQQGIPVAAYDELRARDATRAGGVLDVDIVASELGIGGHSGVR